MKFDAAALRALLALFLDRLDLVHPGWLCAVVPLLLVVVGAAVVAVVVVAFAAFVVALSVGVAILARRGIRAAAAYRSPSAVTA